MLIKNIVLIFLVSSAAIKNSMGQGLLGLSAKTVQGDSLHFSTLAGRKIVLITLPAGRPNNAFLQELTQFNQQLGDSVKVVGLFSKEDVPSGGQLADSLVAWYGGLSVTLLKETYTHANNAGMFNPLVQWMVSKELNHFMDHVITAPCVKFFIERTGRLYAVMPPNISLTGIVVERIMQLNP